jgi:uncharacterized membrane protein
MNQETGLIVGVRATTELATSALPDAPVQPVPQRGRHLSTRWLLGALSQRGR